MLKIAITLRKKDMSYHIYQSYINLLSPYFLIIPVCPYTPIEDIVSLCDALLITGGDDVNPIYYNSPMHPTINIEDPLVENYDFSLIHAFYKAHKKIIGICRGIQVINVYFKGTLTPHIEHHMSKIHQVKISNSTILSKYYDEMTYVNSFHHQCVKKVSPLFKVNAISQDGVIEGIENNLVLALQWHPEKMDQKQKELFIQMIYNFIEK